MSAKLFPCRSCGAKLEFAPGAALKCPYCGFENDIPHSREEIKELDFHAFLDEAALEEEFVEEQTVKCQSCGAESTLDPTISMSHCPFCGTQMMARAKTSRVIKPKALLPFKIEKSKALDNFRHWLDGLWFAPGALKRHARSDGALKGMYIPYWTYDTNTISWYEGERGDDYVETEYYTEEDENGNTVERSREVVRTIWSPASGWVSNDFDDVLVLASWSLPREKTESLEPWDLENLSPYQDEFLSGFQAEAYQVNLAQGFEQAKKKMAFAIDDTIQLDIGGDHQRIHSVSTEYNNLTFKHILLPIWINAYRYQGKSFRFVINARTGEVQGERPWSYLKIVAAALGALAAGGLVYWLIRTFG